MILEEDLLHSLSGYGPYFRSFLHTQETSNTRDIAVASKLRLVGECCVMHLVSWQSRCFPAMKLNYASNLHLRDSAPRGAAYNGCHLFCSLHVQASVAALSLLKSRLPGRFPTDLTALWTSLAEDRKWRKDVAEALLRVRLLNGPEMDAHLNKILQLSRSSTQAVEFAVHLVRVSSTL